MKIKTQAQQIFGIENIEYIEAQLNLLRMKLAGPLDSIVVFVNSTFQTIYIVSFILFLFTFIFLLIPVLIKGNYESIVQIAEFVIIGSGTLAILTFTYALCKDDIKERNNMIVNPGELLFKSTITFIIGMGLLVGFRYMSDNHAAVSQFYHNTPFAEIFESSSALLNPIILFAGGLVLISSVFSFVLGIIKLMKVFSFRLFLLLR